MKRIVTKRLSESACWDLFIQMYPRGLDDHQMIGELIRALPGNWSANDCADLLGRCLWDVFSDNHEVLTADGTRVDLGSFRTAAEFIADFRSRRRSHAAAPRAWDYMDFYLGTCGVDPEIDLCPFYELIFSRMRAVDLDWRYVHRRLHLLELNELRDELDDLDAYDPSEAVARELSRKERAADVAELRASLDAAYREEVERARSGPPPAVVRSFEKIFDRTPAGWPPSR